MTFPPLLNLALFALLLASGLLLPGWLLTRTLRSPAPALSAFLGSAVVLFYLVLGLDAVHVRITIASLTSGLAVITAALFLVARRFRRAAPGPAVPRASLRPRGVEWLWFISAALGFAAVAARAVLEPLSGFDNIFRWDFLARQILRSGTLAFYPPMTADDFTHYGWCDGIPPLVPVLNLWSYLSAGRMAVIATAPRVILEAGLLFYAVGRLARGLWGPAARWPAMAALAVSSLALWGVAMGQETGLTALTLVAMLLFLDERRRTGGNSALFWAGLAAGAGGLSREYGLAWPLIGLATLAWQGGFRTGWKIFGLTAATVAAPWYVRNWLHTGNPLFSQSLGGIFPVNAVHRELMRGIVGLNRVGANLALLPFALKFLAVVAGLTTVLGLCAGLRAARTAAPLLAGIAIVAALWLASISQTAGGWIYAARVLTPAVALCAVLGGGLLSRAGTRAWVAAAVFVPLAADSALRSLYLPSDPFVIPWRLSLHGWRDFGAAITARNNSDVWPVLAAGAGTRGIIVDNPTYHALLVAQGAHPVPLPSPALAVLFLPRSFDDIVGQLKQQGVRFVLLTPNGPYTGPPVSVSAFLEALHGRHQPVVQNSYFLLYDLDFITP